MSIGFLMNDKIYELQANNQLAVILSQFDANFGFDIIEDTITHKLNNFDVIATPNIILAFEDNFKELYNVYPNDDANIDDTRNQVYRNIISILCNRFDLEFEPQEYLDIYTMAYYMYDFFVSRFNQYMVRFYAEYIKDEKDNLISLLPVEEIKKNKDISTMYAKNYFDTDENIGLIASNLPTILGGIQQLHIPDDIIYNYAYHKDYAITELFVNNLQSRSSIFNLYNKILFNPQLYANIITYIRLALNQ